MNAWWIVIFLAIFLIGLTKSGFGSGVGLMIVPMMVIAAGHLEFFGPVDRRGDTGLGMMLPLLVLGDLVAVYQYRKLFSLAHIKPMLPATAIGVLLGGLILWKFTSQVGMTAALIRIEIGVESIALVGLHWWRQWRGVQQKLMPEPWRSHLTGSFAGVSSTLAHAAGPIVTMYLLPLNLTRQLYVGTCAAYFFLLNTAKLPVYRQAGLFQHVSWLFTLQCAPLVLLGAGTGVWMVRHISDKLFSRIVYTLTFVLGWYILVDGVLKLM